MADLKTVLTDVSVESYLAAIPNPARQADANELAGLMARITGQPPAMWGTSIIGFGSYHYKYASGNEGTTMKMGLSARKEHLVLYGVIFYDHNTGLLSQLGTYKQGKGCLYIKRLADVDMAVLEKMIAAAYGQPTPGEV